MAQIDFYISYPNMKIQGLAFSALSFELTVL